MYKITIMDIAELTEEVTGVKIDSMKPKNENIKGILSSFGLVTITITGSIAYDMEKVFSLGSTKAIADWSMLKPGHDDVYKTVTIEITHAGEALSYTFNDVFVVSYHEQFAEQTGSFKLVMRPARNLDAEEDSADSEESSEEATEQQDSTQAAPSRNQGAIANKKADPLSDPKIAKDIEADPSAVYGYRPKPGSSLNKFGIDWHNPEEVAKARASRLEYLEKMKLKESMLDADVKKYLSEGKSMENIAEIMTDKRNSDRISSYVEDGNLKGLEDMFERNLKEYGRKEGPTASQLFEKYGSWEDTINASLNVNKGMNVLLGIG